MLVDIGNGAIGEINRSVTYQNIPSYTFLFFNHDIVIVIKN